MRQVAASDRQRALTRLSVRQTPNHPPLGYARAATRPVSSCATSSLSSVWFSRNGVSYRLSPRRRSQLPISMPRLKGGAQPGHDHATGKTCPRRGFWASTPSQGFAIRKSADFGTSRTQVFQASSQFDPSRPPTVPSGLTAFSSLKFILRCPGWHVSHMANSRCVNPSWVSRCGNSCNSKLMAGTANWQPIGSDQPDLDAQAPPVNADVAMARAPRIAQQFQSEYSEMPSE